MTELSFPAWINKDYFQVILSRRNEKATIKVRSVRVESCSAGGFISTLLRVHVDYVLGSEHKFESFIMKLSTNDEFALQKVGSQGLDVQSKEMMFFDVMAGKIKKIWKNVDENEIIVPQVFGIDRKNEALILEDLTPKNYETVDRMIGLDENHTQLAIKKLAKFHAASLVIHQKHPKEVESFELGMFSRKNHSFHDAFVSMYEVFVDEVETWIGWEQYGKKLRKLQPNFIEAVLRCFDNDTGDLCVLNHGDVWTSNYMFKYGANGEVNDAILIDFQFSHWGSPALDLVHLLYSSLTDELYHQEKIDEYIQAYYYEFKAMLGVLSYDLSNFPTLDEYLNQVSKKLFFGFVYTFMVFPIMTSDDADNDFIAHHSRDERAINFKRRMLKTPRVQETARRMLPIYDKKGLLDFTEN